MTPPRTTLRRKLVTAIMSTSIAVLLLTCAAFITYEVLAFRSGLVRALQTRAEIIGDNSTAALAFQNAADATEVLAAFRRDPHMVGACLYDAAGHVFAVYPAGTPAAAFPAPRADSWQHFGRARAEAFEPIMLEGRRLGTIYLASDLGALTQRYRLYAILVLAVLSGSILLAFALSNGLERRISRPILQLTDSARLVSEQRDYSVRVAGAGDDEIGLLTVAFNEMLEEIGARARALGTSEARQRAILASALDAIVTVDAAGRIVEFNPAAERLFGHARAHAVGGTALDLLVPASLRSRYRRAFEHHLQAGDGGADKRTELTALGANGRTMPVEVSLTRIREQDPPLFTLFVRDITDRRRAEREIRELNADLERRVAARTHELRAANEELEAFSYAVSHDLRAPLRRIQTFGEMLEEEFGGGMTAEARDYLLRVRGATHNLNELVDVLLELSRLSQAKLQRQPVDLTAMARDVFAALRQAQPEREVAVTVADAMRVDGDPVLMHAVVENLLRNAWKFTSRHATAHIDVGCEGQGRTVRYFVRDDGAGFDPRYLANLFKPFQRLHRQEEFEGYGVGLTTVKRIVERHGGRLWAEGEIERGATFWFTLWEREPFEAGRVPGLSPGTETAALASLEDAVVPGGDEPAG